MGSSEILSSNLKKYREINGLSQEELADRSELSTRSYGKIERCEVQTSLKSVDKLAIATGLCVTELLDQNLNLDR